nr:hypothetical protein [Tanacetum cinerariifolium]
FAYWCVLYVAYGLSFLDNTYLLKSDASEGFNSILDFLNGSFIKYTLTVNPNIYVFCIKQFWTTVAVKQVNDVTQLQALVDKKKVVITEAAIREVLRLDDAEGVDCIPNEEIFTELARIGYEKPSTKLTIYKAFFSSQWKFFIHTILQCMSAKRTSWNKFSSSIASAVICLSTCRKFIFSKYIFDSLVRNIDSTTKFYMYPHFLQLIIRRQVGDLSTHTTKYALPALTQKVFTNMRRVGKGFSRVETPLFEGMLVEQEIKEEGDADEHVEEVTAGGDAHGEDSAAHGEVPTVTKEPSIPFPTPPTPPPQPPQDIPSTSQVQQTPPQSPQERMIAEMDKDDDVVLMDNNEEDKKVEEAKIIEIVTAASETVTATSAIIPIVEPQVHAATLTAALVRVVAAPSRRMKGVIIRDLEKESTTSTIIPAETKSKDKGKGILLHAEINKDIDWDEAIDHVKLKAKEDPTVKRYQAIKRKPQTKAQVRKNMMMYLKNVAGFKLDYFKRMSYDDIRPIFEAKFNSNVDFLLKTKEQMEEEENKALQTINETLAEKAANKRKLNEEVHVVDYEIIEINNKPYYKIIRANGTHQLYISFLTLLRNFDREDLEALWSLVKDRFSTVKPKNFFDDFLLTTLGVVFEKPDAHAQIWKNQRTVHGQAKVKSWKLQESCGVRIITFTTTQLILLVERRYPLSRFTLDQMLNAVIDIAKKTKLKQKRTKPSTGIERGRKSQGRRRTHTPRTNSRPLNGPDPYTNMFTMRIHYGGRFTNCLGGKKLFYHYKIPCKGLDIGLRLLSSDSDIADMLQYVHKHKIMDMYVEHVKSVVDPSLNVDEAGPSNVLGHENDVGADEGNCDEAKNEDIGDGKDYEADNGSESKEGGAEDEGQNKEEDENVGEREEEDEGDEEDIVDKEHIVDELKVEMGGFKFAVKGENEDPMQPKLNINETNLEVLDFDSFESDIDDDKQHSRIKGLRKLRKKAANYTSTTNFCVGKEFPNRDVAKEMTKAFRAKAKAQSHLRGDATIQYSLLRYYVQELKSCNPNTTVKIDVYGEENPDSPTRMFRRIYICLGALKDGFRASGREFLGLDGAFMKGQYSRQLLTAVGVDANNGIYSVAYGIVESELSYSWTWFLTCLGDDLELFTNSNFTFISDRQKGLLPAIGKLFPAAEHRYLVEFDRHMDTLKGFNKKAYEWLKKIAPEHWTRSHFSGRANCDLLINNICEVFNRQLLDARDSPIISCLEYVREYLMKRIVIVQKAIERCEGPLTPTVTSIFRAIKEKSVHYTVDWNGAELCQVKGPYGHQCVVNLQQRVCSRRKWEVSGIPCKHVVACIHDMANNGMDGSIGKNLIAQLQIGMPPKKRKRSDGEIEMVKNGKQGETSEAGRNKRARLNQDSGAVKLVVMPGKKTKAVGESHAPAATMSPIRRTKKSASRLAPTKNTT